MSDLISRSALINKIRGFVPSSQDVDFIVRLIDEQPTAYNPEKVVEELEDLPCVNPFLTTTEYKHKAIEIARKQVQNERIYRKADW